MSEHLGPIVVPDVVIQEVKDLTPEQAASGRPGVPFFQKFVRPVDDIFGSDAGKLLVIEAGGVLFSRLRREHST